jgi:hypothetical protein
MVPVSSQSYSVGGTTDLLVGGNLAGGGFEETWRPVKTKPDFARGGRWQRLCVATLSEASLLPPTSPRLGCSRGNPRIPDLGLLDRTMATRGTVLSFFGADDGRRARRKSGVVLTMATTMGLGGVAPQSLDFGRVLRCARREEAPSGAMVVSLVDWRSLCRSLPSRLLGGSMTVCVHEVLAKSLLNQISALVSTRGRLEVCDMVTVLAGGGISLFSGHKTL